MISGTQKTSILRYFLIVMLFSLLSVSAFYLYLHYKKARNLRNNIENLISARENSSLIDSCIINLYGADNYSRLYTLTGEKTYLRKFLSAIDKITDVTNKIKLDKKTVADSSPKKFKELLKEKSEKTDSYIKLRLLTDSLIRSSLSINIALNKFKEPSAKQIVKVEHKITVDTIKQDIAPKKKFLGRIFSAFSSAKNNYKPVVMHDSVTTTTTIAPIGKYANKFEYKIYYNKLNNVNNKLMANETQMLIINNNLIGEIIASLKLYQTVEQLYIKNSKTAVKENLSGVFFEFKRVSTMNFVFLLSLVILVLYNVWKIYKNEEEIIFYSEKAEQYADSKSRFLAGMSHEIRTPLNSVIGFSEQLAQGNLSEMESEQVGAIRSSSKMLLELVNEILDFSKYETGKMNFDSAPFMVRQAIDDVLISMNIHAKKRTFRFITTLILMISFAAKVIKCA
jgi:CHASE3 domain sensor protein